LRRRRQDGTDRLLHKGHDIILARIVFAFKRNVRPFSKYMTYESRSAAAACSS
jgi:hypothetical protein